MVKIDLIKSKDRAGIIWISSIDNPRPLIEITKLWGYSPAALYKYNIANLMTNSNLLKISKVESGKVFYYSLFPGYFDLFAEIGLTDIYSNMLAQDKEPWIKVFDSSRKELFNIEAIQALFRNDRETAKNYAFKTPIIITSLICKIISIKEKFGNIEKIKEQLKSLYAIYNYMSPSLDFAAYLDKVKITKEFINEIEADIKTTALYKFEKTAFNEMLTILRGIK